MPRGLDVIAALLENASTEAGGDAVSGSARGLSVHWRYATRGVGSGKESWTECTVRLSQLVPLELYLRPQTWDSSYWVHVGQAIDLQLDDRAFDSAFIVEGAPSDVVRALLTPPLRAQLVSMIRPRLLHHGGELTVADGKVVLVVRGWLEDRSRVEAFADLALGVAERVPLAVAEAQAKLQPKSGGVYREHPDGAAARAAAAAWRDELQHLATLRAMPKAYGRRLVVLFFIVLGIMLLASGILACAASFFR